MICDCCESDMRFEMQHFRADVQRRWVCDWCGMSVKECESEYVAPDPMYAASMWEPNATWRRVTPYGPRVGARVLVDAKDGVVSVEWMNADCHLNSMVGAEPGDYRLDGWRP